MSRITVIIPIYNAEKYLSATFRCLRNQSFTDFEVLLVNDGSTDDSERICLEAAGSDARFRYVYQENQGVSAARNHGMALSKGEYITFIDADDDIPDNYLEALYNALTANNCQVSVCDVTVITDGKATARFNMPPQQLTQPEALEYLLTRTKINSGPCAKLFKREVLEGVAFPPLKAYEDILFVVDALCQCDRVAVTDETEYRYIQNAGSAMSTFMKMPSKDIVTASERLLAFLIERQDLSPHCFYITASHLMQYVIPLANREEAEAKAFIAAAKSVYRKYRCNILKCSAFPWKEKIVYLLAAYGWLYQDKKFTRI